MPCDTVIENKVELALVNRDLLSRALTALGAREIAESEGYRAFYLEGIRYTIRAGKLQGPVSQVVVGQTADRIKQEYSRQAVRQAARRFGWEVRGASNKLLITKRG